MKKILKLSISFILCVLLWNCSDKETDKAFNYNEIKQTIENTEAYYHDLNISGDEEGAIITKQAEHFQTSELIRNSSTNWSVVYHYVPTPGYTGTDFIDIETNTGSDGASMGEIGVIRISLTITD